MQQHYSMTGWDKVSFSMYRNCGLKKQQKLNASDIKDKKYGWKEWDKKEFYRKYQLQTELLFSIHFGLYSSNTVKNIWRKEDGESLSNEPWSYKSLDPLSASIFDSSILLL